MINSTTKLNDIVRNFTKDNANSSLSQLRTIIEFCIKAGIKFSFDAHYEDAISAFTAEKIPEWNLKKANQEIELLARQNKYQEAAEMRDNITSANKEIHKRFRLEKYETEDFFIPKSTSDIFFLPTQITVIDSIIFENK